MEYAIWLTEGGAIAHAKGQQIQGDHLGITGLKSAMDIYGWVRAGTLSEDQLQLPARELTAQAAVSKIQNDLEEARAKFQVLETSMQSEIQKLLSLGYTQQSGFEAAPPTSADDLPFVDVGFDDTPAWEVVRDKGNFKCVKTGCELRFARGDDLGDGLEPAFYRIWGDLFYSSSAEQFMLHSCGVPEPIEANSVSHEHCLTADIDAHELLADDCYVVHFDCAEASLGLKAHFLEWEPSVPQS